MSTVEQVVTAMASFVNENSKVFEGKTEPQNPQVGDIWITTRGKLLYVPLTELLRAWEIPGFILKKNVWFNIKPNEDFENLIPPVDHSYFPKRQHLDNLLTYLKIGAKRAFYIWGTEGTGKTCTVVFLMAVLRWPLIMVNIKPHQELDDLLMRIMPKKDGTWDLTPGPLLQAVTHDLPILIDEMDLAPQDLLIALNDLIEGQPYFIQGMGAVQATPSFRMFGTGNSCDYANDGFKSRNTFDPSWKNRLIIDHYEPLNEEEVKKVLKRAFPHMERLLRDEFSEFFAQSSKETRFSLRTLFTAISLFAVYKDTYKFPVIKAIEMAKGLHDKSDDLKLILELVNTFFRNVTSAQEQWERRNELLEEEQSVTKATSKAA